MKTILTILVVAMHAFSVPIGVQAEDFTFRRVTPPAEGVTKRITIQVEKTWPYETDDPLFPRIEAKAEPAPTQPLGAEWFWDAVGAGISGDGHRRLDKALVALAENPDQAAILAPTSATLEAIIKNYGPAILVATAGKRVSPAFVLSVIAVESAGKPEALSQKEAMGLMQLIPATAKRFGVEDAYDPVQNIAGGAAYLDWLLGEFKGDPLLSLAGYNAGENAVTGHNGVPPFSETRRYVPKVIAAWDRARMYCQTLPRRVDDGCVFAFERSLTQ